MAVTGRALRTDKSWYYLLGYIWKNGKWVASDPVIDMELVVTDTNGEMMIVLQHRCYESAKKLGVWMALDGNRKKLFSELKARTVEYSCKSRQGISSRKEVWTTLYSNISANLKYYLPECTLTK